MTLGEKIQQCRKKLGMSQEDLGQKMLVSRQTVSLWESDKTMPTIDNLVRLREIFGISLDELLTGELPEETIEISEKAPEPDLKYSFEFSKEDTDAIAKHNYSRSMKKSFIALMVLIVSAAVIGVEGVPYGIVLGISIFWIIRNVIYKKAVYDSLAKIAGIHYEYEEYGEYFIMHSSRDGDPRRMHKLYYSDIKNTYVAEKYLELEIEGNLYYFKEEILPQNSRMREYLNSEKDNKKARGKENAITALSVIMILMSLAAPWLGFFISFDSLDPWQTNWLLLPYAVIPLASVVFGFILKKKGYGQKKYAANIAIGIFCTVLILVMGLLALMSTYTVPRDGQIDKAEQYLGVELPEGIHVHTVASEEGSEATNGEMIYYTSTVYFEEAAVEQFEAMLDTDDRWFEKLPDELEKLVSAFAYYSEGKCSIVIYNITTNQINTVPQESGSYRIITFSYIKENKTMHITEYDIEYEK